MNVTILKQKIRVELIIAIMVIGGFIGVTFLCNCKGSIENLVDSAMYPHANKKRKGDCKCGSKTI